MRWTHWTLAAVAWSVAACGSDGATRSTPTGTQAQAVTAANTWAPAGTMTAPRTGHTATRLADGRVLVAGGAGAASAEIYDPAAGTWAATGAMSVVRAGATATLLPSGLVLVAGGCCQGDGAGLATAELYDPATGAFAPTGSLARGRYGHAATALADGRVLVTGGACYGPCANSAVDSLASAEIYDPSTGAWSAIAKMHQPREYHSSTLLPSGQVLVAGGLFGCDDQFCTDLASAELFDPATGRWTATGALDSPREAQTATLLADGTVLVAGGRHVQRKDVPDAEIYDPATGAWTPTASLGAPRVGQTATLLASGWVLVAGGGAPSAELFQPSPARWVPPGALLTSRHDATATLLTDGSVLVAGGVGAGGTSLGSAERYVPGKGPLVVFDPPSLSFAGQTVGSASASQTVTVTNVGTGPLGATGVAVRGQHPGDYVASTTCAAGPVRAGQSCAITVTFTPRGTDARGAVVSLVDVAPGSPQGVAVDGYGIGADAWAPTGSMAQARQEVAAVRLPGGQVLVAGGDTTACGPLATSELFDPSRGTWSATGALTTPRGQHALVVLANGDVLAAGGITDVCGDLASAEVYDAAAGTWSAVADMPVAGFNLTGTLLESGAALLTGAGTTGLVFHPANGKWTQTGPMATTRNRPSAVRLRDGHVLVTGGGSATTELFDPSTQAWTTVGPLAQARFEESAALLPDGRVLVTGGVVPGTATALSTTEIYAPKTQTWSAGPALEAVRAQATLDLLPNGTLLLAGGHGASPLGTAEIYDPAIGYFYAAGAMTTARDADSALTLLDGRVLAIGGTADGEHALASAELFTMSLVAASPSQGPAGTPVTLTGSGFDAGDTVTVRFDQTVLGATTTSDTGTLDDVVTVPAGAATGAHTIVASGGAGPSASVVFTVTP